MAQRRPGLGRFALGFDPPKRPADILHEAKTGAWPAAWFVVGYLPLALLGLSRLPAVGMIGLAIMVLAAVLGLTIHFRQARWAAVALLVWTLLECLNTGLPLAARPSQLRLPARRLLGRHRRALGAQLLPARASAPRRAERGRA